MDSVKLANRLRLIPLVCLVLMLLIRNKAVNETNPIWMYVLIAFGFLGVAIFVYRMILEKKNETFVAKRYYLILFFVIISTVLFLYQMFRNRLDFI